MNTININKKIYAIASLIESSGNTAAHIGLAGKIRFRIRNSPTLLKNDLAPILYEHKNAIMSRTLNQNIIRDIFRLDEEYNNVLMDILRSDTLYKLLNDLVNEFGY